MFFFIKSQSEFSLNASLLFLSQIFVKTCDFAVYYNGSIFFFSFMWERILLGLWVFILSRLNFYPLRFVFHLELRYSCTQTTILADRHKNCTCTTDSASISNSVTDHCIIWIWKSTQALHLRSHKVLFKDLNRKYMEYFRIPWRKS